VNNVPPKDESRDLEIKLIVPTALTPINTRDRAGGEQQSGAIARILGFDKTVTKSVESFQEDIGKLAGVVDSLVQSLVQTVGNKARFKEVEVALAISGEGSIGFATAGVEATFTLTFERN
jgi:hypothetical protein